MSGELMVKRPVVAAPPARTPIGVMAAILAMLGLGVFFWLSSARASIVDRSDRLPALASTTSADGGAAEMPPLRATATLPAPAAQPFFIPGKGPVTLVVSPAKQPYAPAPAFALRSGYATAAPAPDPMIERMRAPALVVDMAQADVPRAPDQAQVRSDSGDNGNNYVAPPVPVPSSGGAFAPGAGAATDRTLSDTERFSARVGSAETDVAQARRMAGLDRIVPQGAIIAAVMETALNSDQPGFARALTQRDMYSFDGSTVLIPAGSRVIGQYKSGVAQGASRLFVLWTRLIRPDGVSIDLASPATDDLGRGGLGGKVNRHFVQRFGGAILTSVLSGGINAAAASLSGGSTILVGSAGQASSLASQATQGGDIPPTITTRQGARVRIFVARDLDFTRVGPAR